MDMDTYVYVYMCTYVCALYVSLSLYIRCHNFLRTNSPTLTR